MFCQKFQKMSLIKLESLQWQFNIHCNPTRLKPANPKDHPLLLDLNLVFFAARTGLKPWHVLFACLFSTEVEHRGMLGVRAKSENFHCLRSFKLYPKFIYMDRKSFRSINGAFAIQWTRQRYVNTFLL